MKHDSFEFLGYVVTDRVSGMVGVVTGISFDLYGCVQALVRPKLKEDGTIPDAHWFDVNRLKVSGEKVMEPIEFRQYPAVQVPGPEDKPIL